MKALCMITVKPGMVDKVVQILRKKRMYARQISSRGGNLECSIKGDRIQLIGNVYIESERVKNV